MRICGCSPQPRLLLPSSETRETRRELEIATSPLSLAKREPNEPRSAISDLVSTEVIRNDATFTHGCNAICNDVSLSLTGVSPTATPFTAATPFTQTLLGKIKFPHGICLISVSLSHRLDVFFGVTPWRPRLGLSSIDAGSRGTRSRGEFSTQEMANGAAWRCSNLPTFRSVGTTGKNACSAIFVQTPKWRCTPTPSH